MEINLFGLTGGNVACIQGNVHWILLLTCGSLFERDMVKIVELC